MLTGMFVGYLLRSIKLSRVQKVITILIWLLLFLLGIDVGQNESIIKGIGTIGVDAAIITAAAVVGSVLLTWVLWYFIDIRHRKPEEHER